jgi:uncharacterized protein (TIGR02145 family)
MKKLSMFFISLFAFYSCSNDENSNNNSNSEIVTIGTQIWQSKNLDVETYRDGTPIPQVTDPTQWANLTTGAWCYYNNDSANNATYGKLYNWYAVAGIHDTDPSTPNKILTPQGWYIPSDTDWTILFDFLGGELVSGGKMKSTGTLQAGTGLWESPNEVATNESGFSGIPGGYVLNDGNFASIGFGSSWWSSSESISGMGAIYLSLGNHRNYVYRGGAGYNYGMSVRCVKE